MISIQACDYCMDQPYSLSFSSCMITKSLSQILDSFLVCESLKSLCFSELFFWPVLLFGENLLVPMQLEVLTDVMALLSADLLFCVVARSLQLYDLGTMLLYFLYSLAISELILMVFASVDWPICPLRRWICSKSSLLQLFCMPRILRAFSEFFSAMWRWSIIKLYYQMHWRIIFTAAAYSTSISSPRFVDSIAFSVNQFNFRSF